MKGPVEHHQDSEVVAEATDHQTRPLAEAKIQVDFMVAAEAATQKITWTNLVAMVVMALLSFVIYINRR